MYQDENRRIEIDEVESGSERLVAKSPSPSHDTDVRVNERGQKPNTEAVKTGRGISLIPSRGDTDVK